jgi:hypothetical protein
MAHAVTHRLFPVYPALGAFQLWSSWNERFGESMLAEYFTKLANLVKRLRERTLEGEMVWERTAAEGVFLASLPDYCVTVAETIDPFTQSLEYSFQIRNSEGDLVENVKDSRLLQEHKAADHWIEDLHNVARRSALGADEAVDKMLQYLEA